LYYAATYLGWFVRRSSHRFRNAW